MVCPSDLCNASTSPVPSIGVYQRFPGIPVQTRYRGSTHVWSRIQYRLGCFQGPVSNSVPFRLVSESRIQSQIHLQFFLSPGFSPGFDKTWAGSRIRHRTDYRSKYSPKDPRIFPQYILPYQQFFLITTGKCKWRSYCFPYFHV